MGAFYKIGNILFEAAKGWPKKLKPSLLGITISGQSLRVNLGTAKKCQIKFKILTFLHAYPYLENQ
jgi:hypothetical protein